MSVNGEERLLPTELAHRAARSPLPDRVPLAALAAVEEPGRIVYDTPIVAAMAGGTVQLELSGTATVHCIHDRRKRQVTTEAQVAALGRDVGIVYDPAQHRIHRCSCCDNLFFDPSDVPRHCHGCRPSARVHALGGPLADPVGEVDA